MKKRYYFLLMIFLSCLWIYGSKISVYAEEQTNSVQKDSLLSEFDTLLSEFMSQDNLPDGFIPKDCGINLTYDNGGFSFSSDSMYMMEKYGFGANVCHVEDAQSNYYLYVDIVFSDKAILESDDRLSITLPAGAGWFDTEIKGCWARLDTEVDWRAVKDFKIKVSKNSGKSNTISIPLNQIVPGEYGNRLLLSTRVIPADENVSEFHGTYVIWRHTQINNGASNDALAPSVENSTDWKKIAVLAIVLALDVTVAVFVYLKLKQRPKKTDESTTQLMELSKEDIAVLKEELKNNLKLDNEDMEYLKSIGYFDSKSSKE